MRWKKLAKREPKEQFYIAYVKFNPTENFTVGLYYDERFCESSFEAMEEKVLEQVEILQAALNLRSESMDLSAWYNSSITYTEVGGKTMNTIGSGGKGSTFLGSRLNSDYKFLFENVREWAQRREARSAGR